MNPGIVQMCTACPVLPGETLLMQRDVEQRTVDFQPNAIVDGAQLSEPIHREFRSGAGVVTAISAQCILAYLRNYVLRVSRRFQSGPATKTRAQASTELKSWSTKSR